MERLLLNGLSALTLEQVVAHPADPTRGVRGDVMVQANERAWRVFSDSVVPLSSCGPVGASPTPSTRAGQEAAQPTAPFFADGRS